MRLPQPVMQGKHEINSGSIKVLYISCDCSLFMADAVTTSGDAMRT